MRNSPKVDFDKILDQNSYIPDEDRADDVPGNAKCSLGNSDKVPNPGAWLSKEQGLVKRVGPMIFLIGVAEMVTGVVLLVLVMLYTNDYDKLYATEDSKIISLTSFGGLITLTVSGMMLLISLMLNKRRVMWFYVLTSTVLCIYIFVLSVMKIHFALLVLERETYQVTRTSGQFLLSTACVVGIGTLLGSVVHFVGNVTVFTYYNLKYVHPLMFNYGP